MSDLFWTLIVVVFGALALTLRQRGFPRRERAYLWLAFFAHVLCVFVMVWMVRDYFGGGDMLNYHNHGLPVSADLREDFMRHIGDVGRVVLHLEPLHTDILLSGSSTGALNAITGLLNYLLGDSLHAVAMVMSLFALSGQIQIYHVFRRRLSDPFTRAAAWSALFMPSVVFWTSGILKEAVALGGLGWMLRGLHDALYEGRPLRGLLTFGAGALLVGLVKAYILFPFILAGALWFYTRRAHQRGGRIDFLSRPMTLLLGAAVAFGGLILLGELFPRYELSNLSKEAANLQRVGQEVAGGSNFSLASGVAEDASLPSYLLPLGLLSALFRPLPFEIHNAAAAMNAVETTALSALLIALLWRIGLRRAWEVLTSSPLMIFCVAFTLLFAAAVGISTTNIGTLSRYRVPMIPFYAITLLVCHRYRRVANLKRAPRRRRARPRHARPPHAPHLPARAPAPAAVQTHADAP